MSPSPIIRSLAIASLSMTLGCHHGPFELRLPIPTPAKNAVHWLSSNVRLDADDFYLEAKGVRYLANVAGVDVGGDPGGSTYRSLELEWTEHGNPMRLYMYLNADATQWWSAQIRTYDGTPGDGSQWVYYYGDFFRSAIGATFTGNVDLTSSDSDNGGVGKLHFENLRLRAF
jgi:hypothetical protein